MEILFSKETAIEVAASLLVIPCVPDELHPALSQVQEKSGVDIMALAGEEKFTGKSGQVFVLRVLKGLGGHRVLLVGLGKPDERDVEGVRGAGTIAIRRAREMHATTVALAAPANKEAMQFFEGALLGTYAFDRYISKKDGDFSGFESITIVGAGKELEAAFLEARVLAESTNFARDLVNEIPNVLTPEMMASKSREIASKYRFEITVMDENQLEKDGFNLLMAVGKGSIHPPRLIHMIYRPEGAVKKKIAFVGKGVTFDTGGYNLKPGSSMLAMHSDMGGAAAVMGAARAIGELRPKNVEVHFVIPTAENNIDGNAMKPQDIFRGYGKKTVEIQNTDAEGRLILADALAYIQEHKVDTIIDLATLTGACVVALGETTAGIFSDSDALVSQLIAAASTTGEDIWRLPLTKKLDKTLDTHTADMRNVGPRWGGAITAALFLKRWVNIPDWAHIDLAGPAYTENEGTTSPAGGTGFGVGTLVQFTLDQSKSLA